MKAKKLKIHIKTEKFSLPIPALRFSVLRWISKIIVKCFRSEAMSRRIHESYEFENILKNLTSKDIDLIIDQLEQEEPFEIVNVETYDEGKTVVKIYTL